jgi:ubiquinone/menaquinone biosynthesis C-methylase UbiE
MHTLRVKLMKKIQSDTIARMTLDERLCKLFEAIRQHKKVLDLGSGSTSYQEKIPIPNTVYITVDINKEFRPTVCCDAHNLSLKDKSFDVVICVELLEHCHTPERVMGEIFRILKKKGICILSTRFIYPIHGDPYDFYRFTKNSLSLLFQRFREFKIYSHDNRLACIWDLIVLRITPLKIFNRIIKIFSNEEDQLCPCGYVVYAEK